MPSMVRACARSTARKRSTSTPFPMTVSLCCVAPSSSISSASALETAMLPWTLRHAQGSIAVSKALADEMLLLGATQQRLTVIGNGVDVERFRAVDRAQARTMLGIPADAQMIVAVGALIPRKGY